MTITFDLPFPPSENHIWKTATDGEIVPVDLPGQYCARAVDWLRDWFRHCYPDPPAGDVVVSLWYYAPKALQNYAVDCLARVVLRALRQAGLIPQDESRADCRVTCRHVEHGAGYVSILITPAGEVPALDDVINGDVPR